MGSLLSVVGQAMANPWQTGSESQSGLGSQAKVQTRGYQTQQWQSKMWSWSQAKVRTQLDNQNRRWHRT